MDATHRRIKADNEISEIIIINDNNDSPSILLPRALIELPGSRLLTTTGAGTSNLVGFISHSSYRSCKDVRSS